MRLFSAFLLLTVAGCLPARSHAALPQSTLPLPQTTLAALPVPAGCQCPNGGPCTCDLTGCDCAGCSCSACPGKAGIAPNEAEAVYSAGLHRCPLVCFVNQPARSVPGAVSYSVTKRNVPPSTWAGGPADGVVRAADATDAQLIAAARPYVGAAPMPAGPVTFAAAPYMPMMPAFGGNCSTGH